MAGITFITTSTTTISKIRRVDNAFIVGLVLFDMLYTTMEMFDTPFPVTKYETTKSSIDIVKARSIPA